MPRLAIDALSFGGRGVGRLDGKAVFVPLSAPGDQLDIDLVEDRKRFAIGRIRRVLHPGPGRRQPPCQVFGICGGCQWQHLEYSVQLQWKGRLFADILQRQAGIDPILVRPPVGAAEEWHYRNRVQLKCHALDRGMAIGFYRAGSHFVTNIDHCPIAMAAVNRAHGWLRPLLESAPRPDLIPQVDIGCGDDEGIRLVVHHLEPIERGWLEMLSREAESVGHSLFLQSGRKSTLTHVCGREDLSLSLDDPELRLAYGPGGFAQVNSDQNRKLVAAVLEAASLQGQERILDLYCGMGNFSLPIARRCRQVVGIEDYPASIEKARQNAAANRIDNVLFEAATVEAAINSGRYRDPFDVVLLDPPRSGAGEVIGMIKELAPRTIIYVSCDPMTLARDLRPLLHGGYALRSSQAFDLFPQTYHIESLTVLDRR